ncbi:CTP synthase [Tropheryma whipplei]|uniref:CTP synthase n=1 Tax=Tropheryma whipplei (strain Twist) TaxID=203267 RepID=PYRG_TROWT|nr:CTP synthase [Tropheryma whipplei]Q83GX8.1 RecName: Full=CTP synthase; AltName: Full=Cytidine 5'-triphosphate synthase; AltName: Full=Cytidine triphosphate synthetase; Short=CTP synthetase; Short=CTPS; AltName: Full=UTP--ammonia ligase [Tropheryma whipplei str. Twist]AAO44197.1 CTP synthase [Tropheryma whipplei str. Twist]
MNGIKHIFITGGVVSSIGKGLTAASLGSLLTMRGLKVFIKKLDPYLNVDPGTMNPLQHGEVFITEDGAETDLDVGHYERFLDVDLDRTANVTTGQVYSKVITLERTGRYLGETVQVIPHITDEIKRRIRLAPDDIDVIITEIGGTVGDIESQPFIEAARQIRREVGRENCCFIHVSLVPFLESAGEQKTKPTQHSVAILRAAGIQPDALVLRSDKPISSANQKKIALMCDVSAVVNAVTVPNIYEIPCVLNQHGLDKFVIKHLDLEAGEIDWSYWDDVLDAIENNRSEIEIAIIGKYTGLPDAYISVIEALRAGGFESKTKVNIKWVDSDDENLEDQLENINGACIPGGFGIRGIEGLIKAIRICREREIPTLGICLGMQCMVIEYARHVVGMHGASSTEFTDDTQWPVVTTMLEQRDILIDDQFGGTMRLGSYRAVLSIGSLAASLYGTTDIHERHRHRYEVNNGYAQRLVERGLIVSGRNTEQDLIEFIELDRKDHPFYIGTQAHPECKSRPKRPHPLFKGLVAAALARKEIAEFNSGKTVLQ